MEFSDVYTLIGFAGTVTASVVAAIIMGWRTANWLKDQIHELLESQQKNLSEKVDGVSTQVGELALGMRTLETVQRQLIERVAYLEGQSGQPLGSAHVARARAEHFKE